MKFNFNPAQLPRPQRNKLMDVLRVMQAENKNEIEITPVEFPLKLKVKLDDDVEMLLGWSPESDSYSGISMPKDWEPESQKDTADLPKPEPKPEPEPEPEPEPDLSPVVVRVQALARAFVNLIKPLNTNQRLELWIDFCKVLFKELLENEVS